MFYLYVNLLSMSWIKDILESFTETKDPFIKFLFRLTLLIFFIVIAFFAFNIIKGRKVNIGPYSVDIGSGNKDKEVRGDTTKTTPNKSKDEPDTVIPVG